MVYDAARQRLVVFGGWADSVGYLNDTWEFDGASGNWRRVETPQTPTGRTAFMLVYDAARQKVLLFGGWRDARLNETWTYDGTTWTQLSPATTPNGRHSAGIAYDEARQQVVMFGGDGGADETWIWDGSNWNLRTPAARPPGDAGAGMAYDAARQRVVLQHDNRSTWIWDGNNWANVTPGTTPPSRDNGHMAYDSVRQEVVLFGGSDRNDTWVWNGSTWTERSPANRPQVRRENLGFAYHAGLQRIVLHGGHIPGVDGSNSDTWFWDGTDWAFHSGRVQTFDMSGRPSGIWNYTTIDVPPNITVRFKQNAARTAVRWLASGDVTVRGTLDLNGEFGGNSLPIGVPARGGPGGYDGGKGGIRFDQSSSYAGTPGQGPGGGLPGVERREGGADGVYAGSGGYGNVFLQPLTGGSGGGGGAADDTRNGGNGGGGGGAILIASSRDITVNGLIRANGGNREWNGFNYGGRGSGGAILLRADRISGTGSLEAYGGESNNPNGRIRLEAYYRQLAGSSNPGSVNGFPVAGQDLNLAGTLTITRVAGQNVAQPPSGNTQTPDVVFTEAGPISVVVSGTGVPDGTAVRCRITTPTGVVNAGPEFLAGSTATFNVTVPQGAGTIQAYAEYRVSP
jgi:hypothetical protein